MVNIANLEPDKKVFMFLFDNSKSMDRDNMFEKSKSALKQIIKSLEPGNLFKIIYFSKDSDPL